MGKRAEIAMLQQERERQLSLSIFAVTCSKKVNFQVLDRWPRAEFCPHWSWVVSTNQLLTRTDHCSPLPTSALYSVGPRFKSHLRPILYPFPPFFLLFVPSVFLFLFFLVLRFSFLFPPVPFLLFFVFFPSPFFLPCSFCLFSLHTFLFFPFSPLYFLPSSASWWSNPFFYIAINIIKYLAIIKYFTH